MGSRELFSFYSKLVWAHPRSKETQMWENKQTTNKSFVDLLPFPGSKMPVTLRKAGSATVTPARAYPATSVSGFPISERMLWKWGFNNIKSSQDILKGPRASGFTFKHMCTYTQGSTHTRTHILVHALTTCTKHATVCLPGAFACVDPIKTSLGY